MESNGTEFEAYSFLAAPVRKKDPASVINSHPGTEKRFNGGSGGREGISNEQNLYFIVLQPFPLPSSTISSVTLRMNFRDERITLR